MRAVEGPAALALPCKAIADVLEVPVRPGEKSSVSAANSNLYQISGSTEVSLDGEAKILNAGDGLVIAEGTMTALIAGTEGPSTFLDFFLVSAVDLDRPAEKAPAAVKELYRTANPVPDLKPGSYDLNLTRVTLPAQMPSNPPAIENKLHWVLDTTFKEDQSRLDRAARPFRSSLRYRRIRP